MVLILGWSYFWSCLNSGVVLFLGWSCFWGGLVSGVVLFRGWSCFWGGLVSGVVLFLGWSCFGGGLVSGVFFFRGWSCFGGGLVSGVGWGAGELCCTSRRWDWHEGTSCSFPIAAHRQQDNILPSLSHHSGQVWLLWEVYWSWVQGLGKFDKNRHRNRPEAVIFYKAAVWCTGPGKSRSGTVRLASKLPPGHSRDNERQTAWYVWHVKFILQTAAYIGL